MSESTDTDRWSGTITLYDVAREAGVHPSTVSRALDPTKHGRVKDSTREHIISVADRLGYRPDLVARGLQSGRTGTIGVMVADLGNTFITPLVHGIAAALQSSHLLPVIAETQDDHARMANTLDHMIGRRVDGIISLATRMADQPILEDAIRIVPLVLVSRPLEGTSIPQVTHDDIGGGRVVAEHLHSLGHRVVAQLHGPIDVLNFPRRSQGFRSVVEAADMTEIVVPQSADRPVIDEGARLMEAILDQSTELPTAVFAHNDLMAVGALSVLRARGLRVPEDVSLVGYNDVPIVGHLTPPLTTVRQRTLELGRQSGETMIRLLRGESVEDVVLGASLVMRGSVRRIGLSTEELVT